MPHQNTMQQFGYLRKLKMKYLTLLTTISFCFTGSVFAQQNPPPNTLPRACIAEFNKVMTETAKVVAYGIANKTISVPDADMHNIRAKALQGKLDSALARNILPPNECNALVKFANDEKSTMTKMVPRADLAAASACMVEFKKVSDETDKVFADGVAKKSISTQEADAYKKRDEATQKQFDAAVAEKKMTSQECDSLLKASNDEKAALIKLVSRPVAVAAPVANTVADPLAACVVEFKKVHKEIDQIFNDHASTGKITPLFAANNKPDHAIVGYVDRMIAEKRLTLVECNSFLKGANEQKLAVTKLGAPNPVVASCEASFSQVAMETQKIFDDGLTKKTISPQEANEYRARSTGLANELRTAIANKKIGMPRDCYTYLDRVEALRNETRNWAAR